jgi:hypothetical protein
VSPVKYELGFYIPEDGILHSQWSFFLSDLEPRGLPAHRPSPPQFYGYYTQPMSCIYGRKMIVVLVTGIKAQEYVDKRLLVLGGHCK